MPDSRSVFTLGNEFLRPITCRGGEKPPCSLVARLCACFLLRLLLSEKFLPHEGKEAKDFRQRLLRQGPEFLKDLLFILTRMRHTPHLPVSRAFCTVPILPDSSSRVKLHMPKNAVDQRSR